MTGPFEHRAGGIALTLGKAEIDVLRSVPGLLVTAGDGGGRLDYVAHPGDDEAEARYRDLVGDDLSSLRIEDGSRFAVVLAGDPVDPADLEAFMRVVGEARLVLASRLGIEEDGWMEEQRLDSNPEMALLSWLGYLQDAAVEALSELM